MRDYLMRDYLMRGYLMREVGLPTLTHQIVTPSTPTL